MQQLINNPEKRVLKNYIIVKIHLILEMCYSSRMSKEGEETMLAIRTICFAAFSLMLILSTPAIAFDANQALDQSVFAAAIFIFATISMKITAIVVGYLIVKLGHDTLIRGISGDLDFGFEGHGQSVKLKSASPGAFFVLAGSAIIIWGLFIDKPFGVTIPVNNSPAATDQTQISPKDLEELP